jgi:putative two-component system response regulator
MHGVSILHGDPVTILIVDDNALNVQLLSEILQRQGYTVQCAPTGNVALQLALSKPPDLILLDIRMPDQDGYQVCQHFKSFGQLAPIPVIFVSGLDDAIDKVQAFHAGGVDYVTKPFHAEEVLARVRTHLHLRRLQKDLERHNQDLQRLVKAQIAATIDSHIATIHALAKLAEYRDDDTGKHIRRVQLFCQALAIMLARSAPLEQYIDDSYIENLFQTAVLHDIGKVGIPDPILLKPAPLSADEIRVMRAHTTIGAATLEDVLNTHPNNRFINMGSQIARSHHEKWDGSGYPQGLAEAAIPLSARILTVADQYDALRNARPYKPALDHPTACQIILDGDGRTKPSHFDPVVLRAFEKSRDEFARIFRTFQDAAVAV